MDFDELFNEGANDPRYQAPADFSFAGDLVHEIEAEYTGENTVRLDRMKEREKLRNDLANAEKKLRNVKNPRGTGSSARRQLLHKQVAEKREALRKKIARIKVRLDEIAIECGEPIEAEKKEQMEEARKKQQEESKAKFGGWNAMTPYENDLDI